MLLDVFHGDAFHWTNLVSAINRVPFVPSQIGDSGLFTPKPINTVIASFEMRDGVLTLVPAGVRGQRGVAKNLPRRRMVDVRTVHLPQSATLYADEVQGLRAYGSDTETEVAMNYLMQKLAVAKRDLDVTHEYHRIGALRGQVLDADGTTVLVDLGTLFNVTPPTGNITLSSGSTDVIGAVRGIERTLEDKLGGVASSGYTAWCGKTFLDALVVHAQIVDTYRYQQGQTTREGDKRKGAVKIENTTFREYRGKVGAIDFVPPTKALFVPEGVPDMFQSLYAPADYIETVNTMGVPYYTKGEDMPFGKGIDYEVQSNPLHINTRPEAVYTATAN